MNTLETLQALMSLANTAINLVIAITVLKQRQQKKRRYSPPRNYRRRSQRRRR